MRRKFITSALAMAGLMFGGVTNGQATERINTVNEVKTTVPPQSTKQYININAMGGLDFGTTQYLPPAPDRNWQPKFGHVKRHTNKNRCKHNAKLKRR